jgi:hypothetical protein
MGPRGGGGGGGEEEEEEEQEQPTYHVHSHAPVSTDSVSTAPTKIGKLQK